MRLGIKGLNVLDAPGTVALRLRFAVSKMGPSTNTLEGEIPCFSLVAPVKLV